MKKNECSVIKPDDKVTCESLENERIKSQERANKEYHYTSEYYCFAPARKISKVFLESQGYDLTNIGEICNVIKFDDKVALNLIRESLEIVNNERPSSDNCFASALRGSKVFLKAQSHNQKILKKIK